MGPLEKLFFRMIYETTTRPREVLEARIELWNPAFVEEGDGFQELALQIRK
jgi:hypothetical protein